MSDDGGAFWDNRFHWCALAAGFAAALEGRLDDSVYVRELAYTLYETGAYRDRAVGESPTVPSPPTGRR